MLAVLSLAAAVAQPLPALPWQPFTALVVSDDGRRLATGGLSGEVLIWEASTGEVLRKAELGSTPVVGLAFSPDGKQLGVVLLDGGFVFDLEDGRAVPSRLTAPAWGRLAGASETWLAKTSLTGSSAAHRDAVAEGFPDGRIEIRSGTAAKKAWKAHGAAVTGLAWSPDGAVLYSVSADGSFARWDSSTAKELGRL